MSGDLTAEMATEWLGVDDIPADLTIGEIIRLVAARASERWPGGRTSCSLATRWPGYDPRPDVGADFGVILVRRWKTIVDRVNDADLEIALGDLPAGVRANRKVGHPWYETVAHVLLRGANLETRPTAERGLNTLPKRSA